MFTILCYVLADEFVPIPIKLCKEEKEEEEEIKKEVKEDIKEEVKEETPMEIDQDIKPDLDKDSHSEKTTYESRTLEASGHVKLVIKNIPSPAPSKHSPRTTHGKDDFAKVEIKHSPKKSSKKSKGSKAEVKVKTEQISSDEYGSNIVIKKEPQSDIYDIRNVDLTHQGHISEQSKSQQNEQIVNSQTLPDVSIISSSGDITRKVKEEQFPVKVESHGAKEEMEEGILDSYSCSQTDTSLRGYQDVENPSEESESAVNPSEESESAVAGLLSSSMTSEDESAIQHFDVDFETNFPPRPVVAPPPVTTAPSNGHSETSEVLNAIDSITELDDIQDVSGYSTPPNTTPSQPQQSAHSYMDETHDSSLDFLNTSQEDADMTDSEYLNTHQVSQSQGSGNFLGQSQDDNQYSSQSHDFNSHSQSSSQSHDLTSQSQSSSQSHDLISQSQSSSQSHDLIGQSQSSSQSHDLITQSQQSSQSHNMVSQSQSKHYSDQSHDALLSQPQIEHFPSHTRDALIGQSQNSNPFHRPSHDHLLDQSDLNTSMDQSDLLMEGEAVFHGEGLNEEMQSAIDSILGLQQYDLPEGQSSAYLDSSSVPPVAEPADELTTAVDPGQSQIDQSIEATEADDAPIEDDLDAAVQSILM